MLAMAVSVVPLSEYHHSLYAGIISMSPMLILPEILESMR